jgi:hypothetical protein
MKKEVHVTDEAAKRIGKSKITATRIRYETAGVVVTEWDYGGESIANTYVLRPDEIKYIHDDLDEYGGG